MTWVPLTFAQQPTFQPLINPPPRLIQAAQEPISESAGSESSAARGASSTGSQDDKNEPRSEKSASDKSAAGNSDDTQESMRESDKSQASSDTMESTDSRQPESASNTPASNEVAVDPLALPGLTLADVVASTLQSFPQIEHARLQAGVAAGEATSARGFYDHKLQAYSLGEPTGNYENYRNGIGVARQLWWGGYLSAGYRNGRGDFAPWYKERETNKGGELKLSLVHPLLQGRAIDPARVAVLQANLKIQAVAPEIERQVLLIARDSSEVYWLWVASGAYLKAQESLLKLAETRGEQLKELVAAGKNKSIDLIFNDQLIAERRLKVIESRQKFREYGVKLSFYLRDEFGQPLYPREEWVPSSFPRIDVLPPGDFPADLAAALSRRPELRALSLEVQQTALDLRLAENQTAPQLDLISAASQDVGAPASLLNDKGQFELELGIEGELPIQRRKARGKIQSTRSKLAQLDQKIRLQQDKIGVELMTARNALDQAALEITQAEAALRSSIEVVERYTFAFRQGQVDLIYINLLESKVNEFEIKLAESREKWYVALAAMQAALGLDPLEQALNVVNGGQPDDAPR
jgi:outer membrane protein TolC